jgi:FkbM family methyltransferase
MTDWRHRLLPALRLLGLQLRRIGPDAALVGRRPNALRVDAVDNSTWVVQRRSGRTRSLQQIGPRRQRTHLLLDERAARANMGRHQLALGSHLASEHIAWMLRELNINCVLDVGANVGQYGRRLRRAGYTGRIVSFEPVAHLAAELRRVAQDDPDWRVVDCALGDADTETEINVVPGSMSSLLPASDFGRRWSTRLRDMRPETIRVRRLDGMYDQAVAGLESPRVYLKMDTQGYDLQTFEGAGARIADVRGMQSEVACVPIYDGMPRLPEQISVYEDAGFEITGMFPVTRDPETLRVIEFDTVMARPEAMRADRDGGRRA